MLSLEGSEDFVFKKCEDRTGKIDIKFEKLTRLQLNIKYDFANPESKASYHAQRLISRQITKRLMITKDLEWNSTFQDLTKGPWLFHPVLAFLVG